MDKIYHSGVNAWKAQIKAIKDKYPKAITGRTDIGPLPDWLYTDVNNYRYNQQLRAYVDAVEDLLNTDSLKHKKDLLMKS